VENSRGLDISENNNSSLQVVQKSEEGWELVVDVLVTERAVSVKENILYMVLWQLKIIIV
jgi:hypothetical protein